ncbi:MAG TPA: hypothetical protein VJU82_13740 [Acidobacteriaceae bacterium]|nr:hypothetical protein [Acidobacteriaceae bacterium]
MSGFLNLEGEDFAAFLVAAGLGYVAGSVIQDLDWSVYISIILSYHLFLAWLVMNSSGKSALSMPLPMTLVTHAACMIVALGPAVVSNHRSPVFSVFRYGIAALAIFERGWLFSGDQKKASVDEAAAAIPALSVRPTVEDELAWIEYLAKRRPGMTKPGVTIRQEHEAWLRARQEKRAREQAQQQSSGDTKVAVS